jgi:flagellar biosynthetic protein FliQ
MTSSSVVDLIHTAFMTALWLSLPMLATGFIVGIAVSLMQILTSIQDSSFSTVPRLIVFLGALLLALPWMLTYLISYTSGLLGNLARFAH